MRSFLSRYTMVALRDLARFWGGGQTFVTYIFGRESEICERFVTGRKVVKNCQI